MPMDIVSDGYPSLKGLRVFLVEDDGLVAMLTKETLAELGCAAAGVATSVDEALAVIETTDGFDCAILDVRLGTELSNKVAAALIARELPFIVCSGYEIRLPGANIPTVAKPFTPETLGDAL